MIQPENPFEAPLSVRGNTVSKGRTVRMLDRIAASLSWPIGAFVGLYLFVLDLQVLLILYWPWGIIGIPIAILAILCLLPARMDRLWQMWLIAGALTLFGVASVGLPPYLWWVFNMHNAGTITKQG